MTLYYIQLDGSVERLIETLINTIARIAKHAQDN